MIQPKRERGKNLFDRVLGASRALPLIDLDLARTNAQNPEHDSMDAPATQRMTFFVWTVTTLGERALLDQVSLDDEACN